MSQNATGERGSAFGRIIAGALGPLVFPVIAIVLSFIIGAVIILLTGNNPIIAYASLVEGAFGDQFAVHERPQVGFVGDGVDPEDHAGRTRQGHLDLCRGL